MHTAYILVYPRPFSCTYTRARARWRAARAIAACAHAGADITVLGDARVPGLGRRYWVTYSRVGEG